MSFLDQLKGLLSGGGSQSGSVLGVDIGGSSIKIVQLGKGSHGKPVLETYGEVALGPYANLDVGLAARDLPVETITAALKELLVESKVTSTDMVFALPLASTLLTVIELPDVGPGKLAEIIPLEARKYIPTAVTEVALSHWVIPKVVRAYKDPDEEEKEKQGIRTVNVLLAAVHNDVLKRYSDIARATGARAAAFEIEVFSSMRSLFQREMRPVAVLDIGAASSKLLIIEEGVVRSAHLLSVGAQDVTRAIASAKNVSIGQAEEIKREKGLAGDSSDPALAEITRLAIDRVLGEAARIIRRYAQKNHVAIDRVVLSGAGSLVKGLPEVAQSSFDAPTVYATTFDRLDTPATLAPYLSDAGPEFAVAIGAALKKFQ